MYDRQPQYFGGPNSSRSQDVYHRGDQDQSSSRSNLYSSSSAAVPAQDNLEVDLVQKLQRLRQKRQQLYKDERGQPASSQRQGSIDRYPNPRSNFETASLETRGRYENRMFEKYAPPQNEQLEDRGQVSGQQSNEPRIESGSLVYQRGQDRQESLVYLYESRNQQSYGEKPQEYERRGQLPRDLQHKDRGQDYDRKTHPRFGSQQRYQDNPQGTEDRGQQYQERGPGLEGRAGQIHDYERRDQRQQQFHEQDFERRSQQAHVQSYGDEKRGQIYEMRGHHLSDGHGQDYERRGQEPQQGYDGGQVQKSPQLQYRERPQDYDRQGQESINRDGQQQPLYEIRESQNYTSRERFSDANLGGQGRSNSLERSKCPAPPQISSSEVRNEEPTNPLERIYLASKRAAAEVQSQPQEPQSHDLSQPQQCFYPEQQPEVQQDFYPQIHAEEVHPQPSFYVEPQPQEFQPQMGVQASKPYVRPVDDKGRGKLAPWATSKKWGQHFEALRSEVKPKKSRKTPDKNEPRPPNKKSSKTKETEVKNKPNKMGKNGFKNEVKKNLEAKNKSKASNQDLREKINRKKENRTSKSDKVSTDADNKKGKNQAKNNEVKTTTEVKTKKRKARQRKSAAIIGTKTVEVKSDEKSLTSEATEIKIETKVDEAQEVKPNEEPEDEIEFIEEVAPKIPPPTTPLKASTIAEPEVITLEMKLPEPVKTVREVSTTEPTKRSVDYFREKYNLLKKRKTEEAEAAKTQEKKKT